jgi:hypothetical protein
MFKSKPKTRAADIRTILETFAALGNLVTSLPASSAALSAAWRSGNAAPERALDRLRFGGSPTHGAGYMRAYSTGSQQRFTPCCTSQNCPLGHVVPKQSTGPDG